MSKSVIIIACDSAIKKNKPKTGFESITNYSPVKSCYEQTASILRNAEEYLAYIKKHGYHFTEALAEHVSKQFINADKSAHCWTANQIKAILTSLSLTIPEDKITIGDLTYLANMYYSDFYPSPLRDETSCIQAAYKIAIDPDGYKGMAFCRWIADVIGKELKIDWTQFT